MHSVSSLLQSLHRASRHYSTSQHLTYTWVGARGIWEIMKRSFPGPIHPRDMYLICLGWAQHQNFELAPWRFWCRVKDHILQISIMQGQIKSMQVLIDSNQLCLTCPVDILTETAVDWGMTSLMPEEMKIPCIEAASSFHGITYSPFLHLWRIHLCWLRGLLSRYCLVQQSVTLPSKTLCCLIVQRPDKGLVKSRTHRTQQ